MINPEIINQEGKHLDTISQIRIDASQWIETIFLTNRFSPSKEEIIRYCFDNQLLNKKEAIEFANKHHIEMPKDANDYSFFIYHKSLWIISFQKWDFLITDDGYTTTDWKYIQCYDNQWNELWFF